MMMHWTCRSIYKAMIMVNTYVDYPTISVYNVAGICSTSGIRPVLYVQYIQISCEARFKLDCSSEE
jgi:hypothetical protein